METPYSKVTIEECDGETASTHSTTYYKVGCQKMPCIEEVVVAIADEHLNKEKLIKLLHSE